MVGAVCGLHQHGIGATGGSLTDHTSGLEARFQAEVAHAALGKTRDEVNQLVLACLAKYQDKPFKSVTKGGADDVSAPGYAPVKELLDEFIGKGGSIWVCRVCASVMNITDEDLVDGVQIGGAPDTMAFLESGAKVLH